VSVDRRGGAQGAGDGRRNVFVVLHCAVLSGACRALISASLTSFSVVFHKQLLLLEPPRHVYKLHVCDGHALSTCILTLHPLLKASQFCGRDAFHAIRYSRGCGVAPAMWRSRCPIAPVQSSRKRLQSLKQHVRTAPRSSQLHPSRQL
jgi:hypothetical protein